MEKEYDEGNWDCWITGSTSELRVVGASNFGGENRNQNLCNF